MKKTIYEGNLNRDVKIIASIPASVKNEIAANYWAYKEIFLLGFKAKKENPQFIERIRNLELEIEGLKMQLSKHAARINDFLLYIKEDSEAKK